MHPELIGDRYRVESSAGRGGMGTVWLCRDERLDREVAVKQVGLLPNQSVTDTARAFREARSSAGLNHRNVVTVFDVVEQEDHIWLVMEYVPGRSLSQVIREDGPLAPRDVAHIGAQVAEGLAVAHAAGISHRDVKPGNILVRADGVAKISDFGIARTHGDPALTQSGMVTGTPTYFSPHLARGGEPTQADDVWALGATLYAAVEGHPLFEQHPNPVAVLHDIASGRARPPERAGFLDPALRSMLTSDPADRWSMAHAGRQLRALASRHEGDSQLLPTRELRQAPAQPEPEPESEPTPPTAPRPTPGTAPASAASTAYAAPAERGRTPKHRRRWPVLVAAVTVLVLAGLVWALTRQDPTSGGQAGAGRAASSPSKGPSKGPSQGPSKSPSQGPSKSPSQSPSRSPSQSPSPQASSTGAPAGGAAAMEAFVRDYYAAAPGGTDAAWAMLGAGERAQGRGAYDGFWRTIRSVEVTSATARPATGTVEVTLVYRTTDGRTSTERKREVLVPDGDSFLLQSDVPAG